MGLKEIETPNAMISYFAEQLGPLIEKSEIKQPTYFILGIDEKGGKRKSIKKRVRQDIAKVISLVYPPELLLDNNNINDYLIICLSPFKQRTYLY